MDIKLAVFDIAGTTVRDDDFVGKAFQQAFVNHGHPIAIEQVHPYMGVKKIVAVQQMLEVLDAPTDAELVSAIHEDFVSEMVSFYESSAAVKPFDDTENVLHRLQEQNVRIALNTGFPRVIAETIVQRFQWLERGLIDDFIASDEVETGRPTPLMIHRLMQRAGVSDPMQVAKIGDTFIDIEEGKNVGCKYIISVTTGSGTREELEPYGPTHIIDQLSDVLTILNA